MAKKILSLEYEDGEAIPASVLAFFGDVQPPAPGDPPPPPTPDPSDPPAATTIYLWGDTVAPRLWSNLQRNGKPPDAGNGLPIQLQTNDIDSGKPLKLFGSDLMVVFEDRNGNPQTEPEKWASEAGHKMFWHVGLFRNESDYIERYFKDQPAAAPPAHPFYVLASQVKKVIS